MKVVCVLTLMVSVSSLSIHIRNLSSIKPTLPSFALLRSFTTDSNESIAQRGRFDFVLFLDEQWTWNKLHIYKYDYIAEIILCRQKTEDSRENKLRL